MVSVDAVLLEQSSEDEIEEEVTNLAPDEQRTMRTRVRKNAVGAVGGGGARARGKSPTDGFDVK